MTTAPITTRTSSTVAGYAPTHSARLMAPAVDTTGPSEWLDPATHIVSVSSLRSALFPRVVLEGTIIDAGLRDRVNQHHLSTFGAAAAVGLISGLSNYLGSAGLARGTGDRRVVMQAASVTPLRQRLFR